jgi:hypothetical protein
MAAKNILSQLNMVEVATLTDSGTAFIGFGAKADGLYMKNGAAAELRLLTSGDVGVNVASFGHTHSGYQATLSGTGLVKSTAGVITYDTNTYVTGTPWTGMGYVTGTPWTGMGYLTSQISHADVMVDGDFASQGIMLRGASTGVYSILADNSANWNSAYGWGNHSGLYSLLAHTHSGFQATLSGTGLVKSTAGVISYDINAYVTGTPWTGMGYVTGTPWTGMGYLTSMVYPAAGIPVSTGNAWSGTVWGVDYGCTSGENYKLSTSGGIYAHVASQISTREASLGNPSVSGYVLSSTTGGVRSWVASVSYTLPLAANGARGGIQVTGNVPAAGCIPLQLYNESGYVSITKASVEYALTGNITTHTHSAYQPALNGTGYITISGTSIGYVNASYSLSSHTHSGVYEPVLGNPGTSGYVLSSTSAGVRSWIAQGSSFTLPLAANGTRGGVQLGYTNYYGTIGITMSGEQLVCVMAKSQIEYALTGNISSHTHSYAPINGSSANAFSTANLSVTGTISASSTITGSEVYRGSSRTLKKNIADFDFDAIGFLNDVSIMRYSLKSNNSFGIGFIAEDTHPWLSGDDQKSHVFGNHLGILTKAIQQEDQKVEVLKLEVLELQARVRELEIARANGWR